MCAKEIKTDWRSVKEKIEAGEYEKWDDFEDFLRDEREVLDEMPVSQVEEMDEEIEEKISEMGGDNGE